MRRTAVRLLTYMELQPSTIGGQELLNFVKTLLKRNLLVKNVPSALRLGILNPIFKNKGNIKESLSYRALTITPVLTRLIEAVLKARIKPTLLNNQTWYQRGFTENSSPMNCALIVEEFYRNNKDLRKQTYMAYMDAKLLNIQTWCANSTQTRSTAKWMVYYK